MPHLTLHVVEEQLAGREPELVDGLTDAVVEVYGEWARELVVLQMVALPSGRWAVGGKTGTDPAPMVDFGVSAVALSRPDLRQILERLAAGVTDVLARVLGEHHREGVQIRLGFHRDEHTAIGGRLLDAVPPTRPAGR